MEQRVQASHSQYYPWFDWLRIVLATLVMLAHGGIIDDRSPVGNFAVQIFFALSGWLIGNALLKMNIDDLPRFYFNRALRIWIPYYLAFLLLICASLLKDDITPKWQEFVLYKITFVYNIFGDTGQQWANYRSQMPLAGSGNHFWSVNAEEQFYLVAPLILVGLVPYFGRSVVFWACVAIAAWYFKSYASIVCGVFSAVVVHRYGPIHETNVGRFILFAIASAAICGWASALDYKLMAPLCAISVVLLLAMKGHQSALGAFVGGMSYPLYLNHWIGIIVGNAIFKPLGIRDSLLAHAVVIAVNFIIAGVLYRYVDRKVLSSREQLFTMSRAWFSISIAYTMLTFGILYGLTKGS